MQLRNKQLFFLLKIIKNRKNKSKGAALIEAAIGLPFILMLIWMVFTFVIYGQNYAMSTQSARQCALEGAIFYNISNLAGNNNTAIMERAYDENYCPNGTQNCQAACSPDSNSHDSYCAHWIAHARARQFIDSYDLSLSNAIITTKVEFDADNDVVFGVKIIGDYISNIPVFGTKKLSFISKAYVRTLDALPAPSAISTQPGEPEEEESPTPTPTPTTSPNYYGGEAGGDDDENPENDDGSQPQPSGFQF